jgi:hypothetical protein
LLGIALKFAVQPQRLPRTCRVLAAMTRIAASWFDFAAQNLTELHRCSVAGDGPLTKKIGQNAHATARSCRRSAMRGG